MKKVNFRLLRAILNMRRVIRKLCQSEGMNMIICCLGLALMFFSAGNIEPETPTHIGGVILGVAMALWSIRNYEKQQLKKVVK